MHADDQRRVSQRTLPRPERVNSALDEFHLHRPQILSRSGT